MLQYLHLSSRGYWAYLACRFVQCEFLCNITRNVVKYK